MPLSIKLTASLFINLKSQTNLRIRGRKIKIKKETKTWQVSVINKIAVRCPITRLWEKSHPSGFGGEDDLCWLPPQDDWWHWLCGSLKMEEAPFRLGFTLLFLPLWLTKLLSAASFKAASQFHLQRKVAGFSERQNQHFKEPWKGCTEMREKPAENEPSFFLKCYTQLQSLHCNSCLLKHGLEFAKCLQFMRFQQTPLCPFQASIRTTFSRSRVENSSPTPVVVGLYNPLKLWLISPLAVPKVPTMIQDVTGWGINSCKCSLKALGPMLEPT